MPTKKTNDVPAQTAVYLRVSTADQSLASQLPDVERWVANNREKPTFFADSATGKNLNRPAFTEMMLCVRAGQFNRLVVWRLDRLGRTAAGLTALFEELQAHNCTLVSIREGIDLDTPAGRLMAHVLASVAAYETEVRRERVAAGIAAAKARGKKWGGRSAGSKNKRTEKQIAAVLKLRRKGIALAAIARLCDLSINTVKKIIRTLEPQP